MPTYEYECRKCRFTFEEFQPISAQPLSKCPRCGGRVDRLIGTGAGVLFKGSGFYQTDYRSDSYRKAAAAEKSVSGKSAPADGGKAGSKN